MPPMKLQFLKNAGRAASKGGRLLRNVEAVVRYGTPVQRVQAVKKVVEQAAALASHEVTAHVVDAVVETCDSTTRVQLLFALRKRLLDLCRQRCGSNLVMMLVEKLPARNKTELAESLLPELMDLARHKVASHVVRKLLENTTTSEIVSPVIADNFATLACNEVGQFAAAAFATAEPAKCSELLTEGLVATLLTDMDESEVLTSVVRSARCDESTKSRIGAAIAPQVASLVESRRHNLVLAAICAENSSDVFTQLRGDVLVALTAKAAEYPITKGQVGVAIALVHHGSASERKEVVSALVRAHPAATDAAQHPYSSTLLRAVLEEESCHKYLPKDYLMSLAREAAALAVAPAGSQVVQRMLSCNPVEILKATTVSVLKSCDIAKLSVDPAGSFVVQALMDNTEGQDRVDAVAAALAIFDTLVVDQRGTHVAQKAVALSDDEAFVKLVSDHASKMQWWSMDRFGCFTVRALIRTAQARNLIASRREIVNALKPIVAALGRSPWAGHIVLGAMLDVASEELQGAIRNVIFLRCEDYLASPQDAMKEAVPGPAAAAAGPTKGRSGKGTKRSRPENAA